MQSYFCIHVNRDVNFDKLVHENMFNSFGGFEQYPCIGCNIEVTVHWDCCILIDCNISFTVQW